MKQSDCGLTSHVICTIKDAIFNFQACKYSNVMSYNEFILYILCQIGLMAAATNCKFPSG